MSTSLNDIVQLTPAPDGLMAVFVDECKEKEYCEPAAALATVAVDDGFGCIEKDVLTLVISELGFSFAEEDAAFVRLDWSIRKPCQCSTI